MLRRGFGIVRLFAIQAPSADELERQEVREFEESTFRAKPAAEEPACEEAEEREQGKEQEPGKDGLEEELHCDMERVAHALVSIESRLQAEAPGAAQHDQVMDIRIIPEDVQNGHEEDEQDEQGLGHAAVCG